MPFSTFAQGVRSNDVSAVAIEGRAFAYRLRPARLHRAFPKGTRLPPGASIVFRTTRPADYSTPYDTMLKNGVQFAAVEKQQNLFMTVGVRMVPRACWFDEARGSTPGTVYVEVVLSWPSGISMCRAQKALYPHSPGSVMHSLNAACC